MSLTLIFIFIVIIVLIVLIIFWFTGIFTPVTIANPTQTTFEAQYKFPSPWSSAEAADNNGCLLYTFIGTNTGIPGSPNYTSIQTCSQNNTCSTGVQSVGDQCSDDDQIFAQKFIHTCEYGEITNIPITQFNGCLTQNGQYINTKGYQETYYGPCGNGGSSKTTDKTSTRCKGAAALLTFGMPQNNLSSGLCIRDPLYTVSSNGTVTFDSVTSVTAANCSFVDTLNGFPRQIFRLQMYDWNGGSFNSDTTGSFVSIIHRPSGYYLMPNILTSSGSYNPKVPNLNSSLMLVPQGAIGNSGVYWALLNASINPNPKVNPVSYSKAQLVYISDPTNIPNSPIQAQLWTFVTTNPNVCYTVTPDGNGAFKLVPFLTYTSWQNNLPSGGSSSEILNDYTQTQKSIIATFQYIEISMYADLIAANNLGVNGNDPTTTSFPLVANV